MNTNMYVLKIVFRLSSRTVSVLPKKKVTKETEKFYYTEDGDRYSKLLMDFPDVRDRYGECRIELVSVSKNEAELRKILSSWLAEAAEKVVNS